ncbi:MAG: 8-oxo-dGTP diphosphatase MutT [Porticoccaceae bacterium]|jgi:8-oxo-dGTP diphosphatase|nr:8-oxo-dGTP diphosphatase MutT [Porticoccaceae bacterium]MBT5576990.1 8-oxo-dGTP diphosphatase MutT [Porticoccaceae bacterium]MBT7374334.1 8-oxo-dGTP diphosphatase MutT [Porticoccaceae bacterium]
MKRIHVVAAVIYNSDADAILISKRPDHVHQGGFWEFPGGKVDPGEQANQALERELYEELAISVTVASPLMQVSHDYSDKQVLLDIWQVDDFQGQPQGMEGQLWQWVELKTLLVENSQYQFPAANQPILDRLASMLI